MMTSSMIARATTFVVVVLAYAIILLSIMGYYDVVPTSPILTTAAATTTTTTTLSESLSSITSQKLDTKPSAVSVQRANYSPLVNLDRKISSISSDETVHTSIVFIDEFETDRDQAYLNMAIIPSRSIISPEPAVATRSGDVVRNLVGWAWTYASRGAISTYNDAFRVKQQARHILL